MSINEQRWNIFASTLEDILCEKGFSLGYLDDRAGIYREKVARLQRSLREPKFHTLTPEELERVYVVFQFTSDEQRLMHAAILATAIEEMLADRINCEDALLAAKQLLPIMFHILKDHEGSEHGIAATKGANMMDETQNDFEYDHSFEIAVDLYDSAILYLHFSRSAPRLATKIEHVRRSRDLLIESLTYLNQSRAETQKRTEWQHWHNEIYLALSNAQERLSQMNIG
jgi:hypothetical protein